MMLPTIIGLLINLYFLINKIICSFPFLSRASLSLQYENPSTLQPVLSVVPPVLLPQSPFPLFLNLWSYVIFFSYSSMSEMEEWNVPLWDQLKRNKWNELLKSYSKKSPEPHGRSCSSAWMTRGWTTPNPLEGRRVNMGWVGVHILFALLLHRLV